MNLVRWSPFHDMTLLPQMNRLSDGSMQGWSWGAGLIRRRDSALSPAMRSLDQQ